MNKITTTFLRVYCSPSEKTPHKSVTFYSYGKQNNFFHRLKKITEQGELHALYCQSHEWAPQRSLQRPTVSENLKGRPT